MNNRNRSGRGRTESIEDRQAAAIVIAAIGEVYWPVGGGWPDTTEPVYKNRGNVTEFWALTTTRQVNYWNVKVDLFQSLLAHSKVGHNSQVRSERRRWRTGWYIVRTNTAKFTNTRIAIVRQNWHLVRDDRLFHNIKSKITHEWTHVSAEFFCLYVLVT